MLRTVLAVFLLAAVGGIGFYVGRSSVPSVPPRFVPPVSAGSERSRTAQPRMPEAPAIPKDSDEPPPITREASPATLPKIDLPIANLKPGDILDTFEQARGTDRRHEATDIMAPRGTPVVAVEDGVIKKLFTSKPGGLTIYQYDPTGTWCYYYAHLDRYEHGIAEGRSVRRGERIGYVGSTGNADPAAPHLHFAILRLGPDKEWWRHTTPVNPYSALVQALANR